MTWRRNAKDAAVPKDQLARAAERRMILAIEVLCEEIQAYKMDYFGRYLVAHPT